MGPFSLLVCVGLYNLWMASELILGSAFSDWLGVSFIRSCLWLVIYLFTCGTITDIITALAITAFQEADDHAELRRKGDRNALWFFLIAIVSTFCVGLQNYQFAAAAANLTNKLRMIAFKAILRQDGTFSVNILMGS